VCASHGEKKKNAMAARVFVASVLCIAAQASAFLTASHTAVLPRGKTALCARTASLRCARFFTSR
jgi:hypothetical protein